MKTLRLQLLGVGLLIAGSVLFQNCPALAAHTVGPDIALGGSPYLVSDVQISSDDRGNIVVVWDSLDGFGGFGDYSSIRVRTSLDTGKTWLYGQRLDSYWAGGGYRLGDARISRDITGNITVMWLLRYSNRYGELEGHPSLSHSFDGGVTWSPEVYLSKVVGIDGEWIDFPDVTKNYAICRDSSDRVYVLLTTVDNNTTAENEKLFLRYSLNNGQTWQDIDFGLASGFKQAKMACDESGHVFLVGIKQTASYQVIFRRVTVFEKYVSVPVQPAYRAIE